MLINSKIKHLTLYSALFLGITSFLSPSHAMKENDINPGIEQKNGEITGLQNLIKMAKDELKIQDNVKLEKWKEREEVEHSNRVTDLVNRALPEEKKEKLLLNQWNAHQKYMETTQKDPKKLKKTFLNQTKDSLRKAVFLDGQDSELFQQLPTSSFEIKGTAELTQKLKKLENKGYRDFKVYSALQNANKSHFLGHFQNTILNYSDAISLPTDNAKGIFKNRNLIEHFEGTNPDKKERNLFVYFTYKYDGKPDLLNVVGLKLAKKISFPEIQNVVIDNINEISVNKKKPEELKIYLNTKVQRNNQEPIEKNETKLSDYSGGYVGYLVTPEKTSSYATDIDLVELNDDSV